MASVWNNVKTTYHVGKCMGLFPFSGRRELCSALYSSVLWISLGALSVSVGFYNHYYYTGKVRLKRKELISVIITITTTRNLFSAKERKKNKLYKRTRTLCVIAGTSFQNVFQISRGGAERAVFRPKEQTIFRAGRRIPTVRHVHAANGMSGEPEVADVILVVRAVGRGLLPVDFTLPRPRNQRDNTVHVDHGVRLDNGDDNPIHRVRERLEAKVRFGQLHVFKQ